MSDIPSYPKLKIPPGAEEYGLEEISGEWAWSPFRGMSPVSIEDILKGKVFRDAVDPARRRRLVCACMEMLWDRECRRIGGEFENITTDSEDNTLPESIALERRIYGDLNIARTQRNLWRNAGEGEKT